MSSSHIPRQHDWSSMYAPGSEILEYLQGVVDKHKLKPYIKLRHQLTGARYDESTGKWNIRLKRPSASSPDEVEEVDDWADFVFNGIGVLSRWKWPDIPGLKDFKGTLVHSANWNLGGASWEDDIEEWVGKKIGVIGLVCGSNNHSSSVETPTGICLGLVRHANRRDSGSPSRQTIQLCKGENLDRSTPHVEHIPRMAVS